MNYAQIFSWRILKTSMLLALFFLMIPSLVMGQADEPGLFEVVYLQVKPGQEKAFEATVKSHNQKYHVDGLYQASLHYSINGPYGGQYAWIMGPTNFTAMDTRPGKGAHDDDWVKVNEFVESVTPPSYWSVDTKLTQSVESGTEDKDLIWVFDLKSGQEARWAELVGKVKEVYEKKRPNESFRVYWNEFADTKKGHDVAILFGMSKWAKLDLDRDFGNIYEEIHGPNTWHNFLNAFNDTINGRVEWLRERVD